MYFSFCFLLWKADPDPDPDGIGCWCSLLRCRSVIPPQWYLTDCTHFIRTVFHTILTNIDVCTFEINFLDLGLLCVLFASMAQSLWGVPPTVKPTVKLVSVGNEQKLVMYLLSLGGNISIDGTVDHDRWWSFPDRDKKWRHSLINWIKVEYYLWSKQYLYDV